MFSRKSQVLKKAKCSAENRGKRMLKKVKYSIPYNGDLELMKWAIGSGQVYEVYFGGPAGDDYSSSDRESCGISCEDVMSLVKMCDENGVGRNFLMNKSMLYFENIKKIFAYIKSLKDYGGITSLTVADPMIVPYLKKGFPHVDIQSSVFLHIDNANKVREAWKMGITGFCLDVSLNRNGPELERIRDLKKYYPGMTIKLLANHGCFQNCFYSLVHEDWLVLKDLCLAQTEKKYMLGNLAPEAYRCVFRMKHQADEIKRPFIRPEDVGYYEDNHLTDYIKICYRVDSSPVLQKKMKAYFDRSYDGDLFDLAPANRDNCDMKCRNKNFPENFIDKVLYCGFLCEECRYCEKVALGVLQQTQGDVNLSGMDFS